MEVSQTKTSCQDAPAANRLLTVLMFGGKRTALKPLQAQLPSEPHEEQRVKLTLCTS